MKQLPQISDSEWQVMKVIWNKSPITAVEIIEELKINKNWSPKTVRTLISRLVTKKAISYEIGKGKAYLYYPIISKKECIKKETKSFVHRVFNGSFNLMVKNFIEQERLSPQEIEELKKILNEK